MPDGAIFIALTADHKVAALKTLPQGNIYYIHKPRIGLHIKLVATYMYISWILFDFCRRKSLASKRDLRPSKFNYRYHNRLSGRLGHIG